MTIDERHHLEGQSAEQRKARNELIAAAAQERIRRSIVDHCTCPPGHPAHQQQVAS